MSGNRTFTLILLLSSIFTGLFNCVNSDISDSGGGIDIGNPVKVSVVDSLDRPISGASVRLIRSERWYSSVLKEMSEVYDSSITLKSGVAEFDSLDSSRFNLQIDHATGGAFIEDVTVADLINIKTVRIRKYSALSGTIKSTSGKPSMLRIKGTAYKAAIDSNGSFLLYTAVNGMCTPVVISSDTHLMATETINISSLNTTINIEDIQFNTLLIDDFEDSSSTLKINRFVNGYKIYTDETYGSVKYQIVRDGYESTNGLTGTMITNGVYCLMGFYLGIKPDGDSVWNFRSATGLSFYAKGSGKLNVSIESDSIEKMGSYKHFSADIVLQPQWQLFNIKFDTLKFKEDLNLNPDITWYESAATIKKIEFNALDSDTVQFTIDNLKIIGLDFSEVYK